jgi:hypothetical protein
VRALRAHAPEAEVAGAGRICPADYRYSPAVLDRTPELACDVLYVVGGLYGNLAALDVVERLAAAERATIVLNGDFHWFDAEPAWFAEVERRAGAHHALRGNVETEVARVTDIGVGCGCAYPDTVDDGAVRRSNAILSDLRHAAAEVPAAAARLSALPMHMVASVGALRVGIVHGDACSLAGWSFTPEALDAPAAAALLDDVHAAARLDVLASTHTCLAVLRERRTPTGRLSVVNNGAAGMPNFRGQRQGLLTRIAVQPRSADGPAPLYGLVRDDVHIEAIPIDYDHDGFCRRFLGRWPAGSAAHRSYFARIVDGPDHAVARAAPPRNS